MKEIVGKKEDETAENQFVGKIRITSAVDSVADELKEDVRVRTIRKINGARRRLFLFRLTSAAAVIAILFSIGFFSYRKAVNTSDVLVRVEALGGETKEVSLPDESKVVLNAGSSLEYHTEFKKNRKVKLSGEAYFEVTPDAGHPFVVCCDVLDVRVYGTKFNVRSYDESLNTEVTLVEGEVGVSGCGNECTETFLKPGEQLLYNKEKDEFLKREITTEPYLSWLKGEIYFEKNNFEEIAAILGRHFDKKFFIASEELKKIKFTGQFKSSDSLDEILHIISWDNRIRYDINNDSVYIYEK